MPDIYSRLSRLTSPGAARNMLTSAPSEDDDEIQDFAPGNTDFLTQEQIADAADFQAAKQQEENRKDLAAYAAARQAEVPSNSFLTPEQLQLFSDLTNARMMPTDQLDPNDQFASQQELTDITAAQNESPVLDHFSYYPADPNELNAAKNPYPTVEDTNDIYQALGKNLTPDFTNLVPQPPGPSIIPATTQTGAVVGGSMGAAAGSKVPLTAGASPKPIPTTLEPVQPSLGSVENLQAAQDAANRVRSLNQGSQGLDLVSAGIAGLGSGSIVKPSGQELFKQQAAGADKITTDYKDLVAMEKNDAKSPVSKAMQRYAKKLGFDAKGLSAGDMEKLMPFVFKGFEAEENRKSRKEELGMRLAEMNERFAAAKQDKLQGRLDKLDKETRDRFGKMSKLITAEVASSRSAFGKAANNVRSAEAILTLAEGRKLDTLNNREIQEVARSLDALLSQGQATISGTEHLVPKAYRADAAKIAEYITAKNKGAGMGSFLKQMLETVRREKDLAHKQIKKTQGKLLAPYHDLKDKDPETWALLFRENELDPDLFTKEAVDNSDEDPAISKKAHSKFGE